MRKNTKFKFAAMASLWSAFGPLASAQIAITPSSLGNFTSTVGNASATQSLSLNASGPSGAIVVTAPEGFEVSTNSTSGFGQTITLGKLGGTIQSVYKKSFAAHTARGWDGGSGSEFPNDDAFAAITANGAVTTWGYSSSGGYQTIVDYVYDGPGSFSPIGIASVEQYLTSNVTEIYSNNSAFSALKSNGAVVAWGAIASGGNSTIVLVNTYNGIPAKQEFGSVASLLSSDVTKVNSNCEAFAALKSNGSVVAWGNIQHGGNSSITQTVESGEEDNYNQTTTELSSVRDALISNVSDIYSNRKAFVALKKNGSVVTWGDASSGGNSADVSNLIGSGVIEIYSSDSAFAALKNNGSVVTWGDASSGGNSINVASLINSGVVKIYSSIYFTK